MLSAADIFFPFYSMLSLVPMLYPALIFTISYDSQLTLFSGN